MSKERKKLFAPDGFSLWYDPTRLVKHRILLVTERVWAPTAHVNVFPEVAAGGAKNVAGLFGSGECERGGLLAEPMWGAQRGIDCLLRAEVAVLVC